MASPAGGGERTYMRLVTARARELLKEQGYDINTADFQALMWYPEKQLAEKMGIDARLLNTPEEQQAMLDQMQQAMMAEQQPEMPTDETVAGALQ